MVFQQQQSFVQNQASTSRARFNTIVLVDDKPVNLSIYQALLNAMSVANQIKTAKNGQEILHYLRNLEKLSEVPELLFVDLAASGYEGLGFLEEFSQLSDFVKSKCKIVLISSNHDVEAKHQALLNPSVVRYLQKPIDVFQLREFTN